jgi:Zn-dependent protease with chaperone function
MFAARGMAVSASVFFLLYLTLSLAICCWWNRIFGYSRTLPAKHRADVLFALRMFPAMAAAAVTAAFIVPSFLLLEPRAIEEPFGVLPLGLSICGISLAVFGAAKATLALMRASRMIGRWTSQAKAIPSHVSVPVLSVGPSAPALTAAGILRPRVLLSGAAQFALNESELQTALRHEVAHVRRRDNLKKLLLCFVAFPGMKKLETAWMEATEMAADDAAVSNVGEALDLAATLIKLSKLNSMGVRHEDRPNELMTAFVLCSASLLNARVERLIAWSEDPQARKYSPWYAAAAALTTVAFFAVIYGHLLAQVHKATEWLVR